MLRASPPVTIVAGPPSRSETQRFEAKERSEVQGCLSREAIEDGKSTVTTRRVPS
jgi:hypothetical protein